MSKETKSSLADFLKTLADAEDSTSKVIVVGINKAGDSLIQFSPDLVNRLDIVRFEAEPRNNIEKLLALGQDALNIKINVRDEIAAASDGSFYLAQMLARQVCADAGVLERLVAPVETTVSFEAVKASVWDRLAQSFRKRTETFCRGSKLRPEGRAPYLHILNWLANGDSWTIELRDEIRRHPELRGSVGQVVDKGFLEALVNKTSEITDVLHYDKFSEQVTVALSFAGSDRGVASALFEELSQNELEVFYDENEQHRILAEDVEEYLRPIYQSEALFVLVLLGKDYPNRIWTKFESEAFQSRFADGSVIPVWFSDVPPGMFDATRKKGGLSFDPSGDTANQVKKLSRAVLKKLADSRNKVSA